jgi:hypothetical protein
MIGTFIILKLQRTGLVKVEKKAYVIFFKAGLKVICNMGRLLYYTLLLVTLFVLEHRE